jgi:pyrroline-5-carboxylate reductase
MIRPTVLLIGGGNMGRALLAGWQKENAALSVTIVEPHPIPELKTFGTVFPDARQVTGFFDIIVLAIKPQMFDAVLPGLKKFVNTETVFLSIAGGKSMASISTHLGEAAIIRAMPNTPAMVGEGITVCVANAEVTETQKETATDLLAAVGQVVWIDQEDHMHAVTALSGSGPAYVFALIEALQQAGEKAGLPKELAAPLARQTVIGSAALAAQEANKTPAQLREQVTSPGGTTEAALKVLKGEKGLDALLMEAIQAAAQRSQELGS